MLNSLAMIHAGSNGNTSQEIANILGKDKTKEEIIDYYSNFIQRHKTINEDDERISLREIWNYYKNKFMK
uniref:Uncharacterized protein n=1 Tax=Panagrolaimus sp. PS1159 TaxID=55785 RepID=A0AC35GGR6_9BILA